MPQTIPSFEEFVSQSAQAGVPTFDEFVKQSGKPAVGSYPEQKDSTLTRAGRSFANTLKGVADSANPILNPDRATSAISNIRAGNYRAALMDAVRSNPMTNAVMDAGENVLEQGKLARDYARVGNTKRAIVSGMNAIPVVGQTIGNLSRQAAGEPVQPEGQQVEPPQAPDLAGALTSAGTMAALAAASKLPAAMRSPGVPQMVKGGAKAVAGGGIALGGYLAGHPILGDLVGLRMADSGVSDIAAGRAARTAAKTPPTLPQPDPRLSWMQGQLERLKAEPNQFEPIPPELPKSSAYEPPAMVRPPVETLPSKVTMPQEEPYQAPTGSRWGGGLRESDVQKGMDAMRARRRGTAESTNRQPDVQSQAAAAGASAPPVSELPPPVKPSIDPRYQDRSQTMAEKYAAAALAKDTAIAEHLKAVNVTGDTWRGLQPGERLQILKQINPKYKLGEDRFEDVAKMLDTPQFARGGVIGLPRRLSLGRCS